MIVKCQYILLLLLIYVHSQLNDFDTCSGASSSKSICLGRLTDEQIGQGYHCCFFTASDDNEQCVLLSEEEFEDFDNVFDGYKSRYKDVSLDCKSCYLKLGIFISLLILL